MRQLRDKHRIAISGSKHKRELLNNSVVFDCRFKQNSPPSRLSQFIMSETNIAGTTFETLIDYLIINVYILKKLGEQKQEVKRIIRSFTNLSEELRQQIPVSVHTSIMGSNLRSKLDSLKIYV